MTDKTGRLDLKIICPTCLTLVTLQPGTRSKIDDYYGVHCGITFSVNCKKWEGDDGEE